MSAKDKLNNVAYIVTIKATLRARDWQWLADECRNLQEESNKTNATLCHGGSLPPKYENALSLLYHLLNKNMEKHQEDLGRLTMRSPSFREHYKITNTSIAGPSGWAFDYEVKDYETLWRKDQLFWCLCHLTRDQNQSPFLNLCLILQHLDDFFDSSGREEFERIDQEILICISDIAAIQKMLDLLELHHPRFQPCGPVVLHDNRPAWQTFTAAFSIPISFSVRTMGLGHDLRPLSKFRRPKGKKDERWLSKYDNALEALRHLWWKARQAHERALESQEISRTVIDYQLDMMKQSESPEHLAALNIERQDFLNRLKLTRERLLAKNASASVDLNINFGHDLQPEDKRLIPDVPKTKAKTRGETIHAQASDQEHGEEDQIPVLYTFKKGSVPNKVISLMYPNPDEGSIQGTIAWSDFLITMTNLYFNTECRGGSAFTFRGKIMLPGSPEEPQERSIAVHRPHPDSSMGPILVRSIGKRCARWFGWRREHFLITDSTDSV